ncbi:MAG TPA: DUF3891 family protein [Lacipirellula sp.]
MIRRDVQLADGAAGWALISQIEHARISAQLAAHCTGRFAAGQVDDSIRREVLAAIEHHDDGWADWERSPRQHSESGKPVSFMELEPAESTFIWTKSVAVAEEHGPLAAWLVAGHFARLLENSEHAHADRHAKIWLDGVKIARREAIAQWQKMNPAIHTAELAEEALQWLWSFDELSLWFCCTCPAADDATSQTEKSRNVGQDGAIEMKLSADTPGIATASPWRFDAPAIELQAAARVAPARRYRDWQEVAAAASSVTLKWRLQA